MGTVKATLPAQIEDREAEKAAIIGPIFGFSQVSSSCVTAWE
jgi:hypothetical protein